MADDASQKKPGKPPTHLLKVKERSGKGKTTIGEIEEGLFAEAEEAEAG